MKQFKVVTRNREVPIFSVEYDNWGTQKAIVAKFISDNIASASNRENLYNGIMAMSENASLTSSEFTICNSNEDNIIVVSKMQKVYSVREKTNLTK